MRKKLPAVAKLCSRCEAYYSATPSTTCQVCFAQLDVLDEEDARRVAEFKTVLSSDPNYIERKAEEDERFKEHSFGACLVVLTLIVGVIIVSVFLIKIAGSHQQRVAEKKALAAPASTGNAFDRLFPARLGFLNRGAVTPVSQDGLLKQVLRTTYGQDIQVYVLPCQKPSPQALTTLRTAVDLICSQTNPPLISQEVHVQNGYYAIIGANGGMVGELSQRLVNTHVE